MLGGGQTGNSQGCIRSLAGAWPSDPGQHVQGCLSLFLPELSKGKQTSAPGRKALSNRDSNVFCAEVSSQTVHCPVAPREAMKKDLEL